jgi:hypothetical protein
MPRRNRNVRALAIDPDKLADQARQLTTELGCPGSDTLHLVADEFQLGSASAWGTGKPTILRTCIAEWVSRHPGGQAHIVDAKAVTPDGW